MPCTGIFIPRETQAAVENESLLSAYVTGFIQDGNLMFPLPEIETFVRQHFGYHLRLVYCDPNSEDEVDEPAEFFHLKIVHESSFYSKRSH